MSSPPMDRRSASFDMNEKEKYADEFLENASEQQQVDILHFEGYSEEDTKAKAKAFVRKIDFRILPILILLFILNILDRSNIANARIGGMSKDLKFTGLDYNNLVVGTFAGYVAAQLFVGFFVSKISPAIFLSAAVFIWGIVSMCCGFSHSFGTMMVLRVLVGIAEAPFFPGAILILSSFYTRQEMAPRIAFVYAGNSISNGFGGLLAAAIMSGMEGKAGLRGWRWLFIIEGLLTVFVAFGCFFLLPSLPSKTTWLTEEERRISIWRSSNDAMGDRDETEQEVSKWQSVKMVWSDWKIMLLILQQTCIACAQSYTYFFPSIAQSLGYGTNQTLLLTAPPYFFAFVCSLGVAWSSAKRDEKAWHIAIPMILCSIGNVLVITLPKTQVGARYFSMFLMTLGSYCAFNLSFAWITSTVPRPRAKRAGALFVVNAMANASHFFTPYMFPSTDGPRYIPGGAALAGFCIAVASCAIVIKFALQRENAKMEKFDEQEQFPYPGSLAGIPKGYRFGL